MINILNSQYLGTLYFGSPNGQRATVVFDTGSNWLTVTSDLCKECSTQAYKTKGSDSAINTSENISQKYGSADLSGLIFNDTVCMSKVDFKKHLSQTKSSQKSKVQQLNEISE